ncbi:MAG: hypothetical protein WD009_07270 [Phycisphaeraceae bacterium]
MRLIERWRDVQWLGEVYARVPSRVMSTADGAARYGEALARRHVAITRVTGTAGDCPACVYVADHAPSVAPLLGPLFDRSPEGERVDDVAPRRLPALLDELAARAELVVARCHSAVGQRRLSGSYLRVPEAVECCAELSEDDALPARARRGQAGNLRALRRAKLRWEVSHDRSHFAEFYEQMYVPFAHHRFGELAYVRGAGRLRSHFLRGGLIRVMDGQRWVGGCVYSVVDGALRVWVVGVADGDTTLIERGVMTANWAFAMERAHELGLTRCHMGLSRPSLADGVLVYKKRWGASLRCGQPTHCDLFMRWERFNPAVARLLKASPLIFHDGVRLSGLAVIDRDATAEAIERLAVEYAMPHLHRLLIVSPGLEQPRRMTLEAERVRGLEVRLLPAVSSARLVELIEAQGVDQELEPVAARP